MKKLTALFSIIILTTIISIVALPGANASNGVDWIEISDSDFTEATSGAFKASAAYGGSLWAAGSLDGHAVVYEGTEGWTNQTPEWDEDNVDVTAMAVVDAILYVGTQNSSGSAEVWSFDDDGDVWTKDTGFAFTDMHVIYNISGTDEDHLCVSGHSIVSSGTVQDVCLDNEGDWAYLTMTGIHGGTFVDPGKDSMVMTQTALYQVVNVTTGPNTTSEIWEYFDGEWTSVVSGLGANETVYSISSYEGNSDFAFITYDSTANTSQIYFWHDGDATALGEVNLGITGADDVVPSFIEFYLGGLLIGVSADGKAQVFISYIDDLMSIGASTEFTSLEYEDYEPTYVNTGFVAGPFAAVFTSVQGIGLMKPNAYIGIMGDDDSDGDGIDDDVEDGFGDGDSNGDGDQDSGQEEVATMENPVTDGYVSVELDTSDGCTQLVNAFVSEELGSEIQDSVYDYPYGLVNFAALCGDDGDSATVSIYYDRVIDSSIIRKQLNTGVYTNLDVTIETVEVNNADVTKISYTITDGDEFDLDEDENSQIVDPVGPAALPVAPTATTTPTTVIPAPVVGSLPATGTNSTSTVFYGLILMGMGTAIVLLVRGKKASAMSSSETLLHT